MKNIILFLLILFTPTLVIAKNETNVEKLIFDAPGGIGFGEQPDINSITSSAVEAIEENKTTTLTPEQEAVKEEVDKIKTKIGDDFNQFTSSMQSKINKDGKLSEGYIPIEAHVAKFFMVALSGVAKGLYKILKPFLNIMIITLFAFWIMIEGWKLVKEGGTPLEVGYNLVKRGLIVTIWLWVLNSDPVELFSMIMMPLISIGTTISEFILKNATDMIGANIPDTCSAIHGWLDNDTSMILAGNYAADLICMPTRITAFFYACIASGLGMITVGLFTSPLLLVSGIIMVVLFLANLWKFFKITLGVIMDLFFVLLFLPFTALTECFKGLEYKGFGARVWQELAEFVKGASLSEQIMKFINAIIYFVVLSIISSLVLVMVSGLNPLAEKNIIDVVTGILSYLVFGNIITIIIMGFLASYLLGQVDTIAKSLGADIDPSFGTDLGKTAETKAKKLAEKAKAIKDALMGKSGGTGGTGGPDSSARGGAGTAWPSGSARAGGASPTAGSPSAGASAARSTGTSGNFGVSRPSGGNPKPGV